MIKVGLVGEDPHDTSSIKNLLEQRYKSKLQFFPLGKLVKGSRLDTEKLKNILRAELKAKSYDFIVYIKDLDAFESQTQELNKKVKWFKDLNDHVNGNGILLLNIWELEALIFGDIDAFNKIYNTKHKPVGNPMFIKEPKEELKRLTFKSRKQFAVSHCPEIFKQLNIDKVEQNCSCFKKFITEFDEKLNY